MLVNQTNRWNNSGLFWADFKDKLHWTLRLKVTLSWHDAKPFNLFMPADKDCETWSSRSEFERPSLSGWTQMLTLRSGRNKNTENIYQMNQLGFPDNLSTKSPRPPPPPLFLPSWPGLPVPFDHCFIQLVKSLCVWIYPGHGWSWGHTWRGHGQPSVCWSEGLQASCMSLLFLWRCTSCLPLVFVLRCEWRQQRVWTGFSASPVGPLWPPPGCNGCTAGTTAGCSLSTGWSAWTTLFSAIKSGLFAGVESLFKQRCRSWTCNPNTWHSRVPSWFDTRSEHLR